VIQAGRCVVEACVVKGGRSVVGRRDVRLYGGGVRGVLVQCGGLYEEQLQGVYFESILILLCAFYQVCVYVISLSRRCMSGCSRGLCRELTSSWR